jgi:hypothetical protein
MKDIFNAILLNIAAAIIFWLVFAFVPEKRRRRKLRPKLELGIYQVYSTLFALFDSLMRFDVRSPSSFQTRIKGKMLHPAEIELGIQNKCLNETFLYDQKVNHLLIPIGKELFENRTRVDRLIERVFAFSEHLTTNEILLLEQIRGRLEVYDLEHFDRCAATRVGDTQYLPVNPSLSYMGKSLAELYELFGKLQDIAFRNGYEDRDVVLDKVQSYYEQGQHRRCKRLIRRRERRYASDSTWLSFYLFLCEYKMGRRLQASRSLAKVLESKPDLVSSRGFLLDAIGDSRIRKTVEDHYTSAELAELDAVMRTEVEVCNRFVEQANTLRKYYDRKAKDVQEKGR